MNVTMIQLEVRPEEETGARIARVAQMLETLEPTDLILLPELWDVGFTRFDRYRADAEPSDGPTARMLAQAAQARGCYLFGGSLVECDGGQYYNTSLLFGPDGHLLARYRKQHLFRFQSQEAALLTPGQELVSVSTELAHFGFATCYDLRFPEHFRALVDRGVNCFLLPAAWPGSRMAHWRILCQARALENQSWVLACNCTGKTGGHSMVVSPQGEIRLEAGVEPGIFSCRIQMEEAAQYRREFPVLEDRL